MRNANVDYQFFNQFEYRIRRCASDDSTIYSKATGISILPFEVEDAEEAGDIRAALERVGRPIGPYDILIAAQVRRRGATLVTANQREFERVPGLAVEDWGAA